MRNSFKTYYYFCGTYIGTKPLMEYASRKKLQNTKKKKNNHNKNMKQIISFHFNQIALKKQQRYSKKYLRKKKDKIKEINKEDEENTKVTKFQLFFFGFTWHTG